MDKLLKLDKRSTIIDKKNIELGLTVSDKIPYGFTTRKNTSSDTLSTVVNNSAVSIKKGTAVNGITYEDLYQKLVDNDLYNEQLVQNIVNSNNIPGPLITDSKKQILNGPDGYKYVLTSAVENEECKIVHKIVDINEAINTLSAVPELASYSVNFVLFDGEKYVVGTNDGLFNSYELISGWTRPDYDENNNIHDQFVTGYEQFNCKCCFTNLYQGVISNDLDNYLYIMGTNNGLYGLNTTGDVPYWDRLDDLGDTALLASNEINSITYNPTDRKIYICTEKGIFYYPPLTREIHTTDYESNQIKVIDKDEYLVKAEENILVATDEGMKQSKLKLFPDKLRKLGPLPDNSEITHFAYNKDDLKYIVTSKRKIYKYESSTNKFTLIYTNPRDIIDIIYVDGTLLFLDNIDNNAVIHRVSDAGVEDVLYSFDGVGSDIVRLNYMQDIKMIVAISNNNLYFIYADYILKKFKFRGTSLWDPKPLDRINEFVTDDNEGLFVPNHKGIRIMKIEQYQTFEKIIKLFSSKIYFVNYVNGHVLIGTDVGCFEYDDDSFEAHEIFNNFGEEVRSVKHYKGKYYIATGKGLYATAILKGDESTPVKLIPKFSESIYDITFLDYKSKKYVIVITTSNLYVIDLESEIVTQKVRAQYLPANYKQLLSNGSTPRVLAINGTHLEIYKMEQVEGFNIEQKYNNFEATDFKTIGEYPIKSFKFIENSKISNRTNAKSIVYQETKKDTAIGIVDSKFSLTDLGKYSIAKVVPWSRNEDQYLTKYVIRENEDNKAYVKNINADFYNIEINPDGTESIKIPHRIIKSYTVSEVNFNQSTGIKFDGITTRNGGLFVRDTAENIYECIFDSNGEPSNIVLQESTSKCSLNNFYVSSNTSDVRLDANLYLKNNGVNLYYTFSNYDKDIIFRSHVYIGNALTHQWSNDKVNWYNYPIQYGSVAMLNIVNFGEDTFYAIGYNKNSSTVDGFTYRIYKIKFTVDIVDNGSEDPVNTLSDEYINCLENSYYHCDNDSSEDEYNTTDIKSIKSMSSTEVCTGSVTFDGIIAKNNTVYLRGTNGSFYKYNGSSIVQTNECSMTDFYTGTSSIQVQSGLYVRSQEVNVYYTFSNSKNNNTDVFIRNSNIHYYSMDNVNWNEITYNGNNLILNIVKITSTVNNETVPEFYTVIYNKTKRDKTGFSNKLYKVTFEVKNASGEIDDAMVLAGTADGEVYYNRINNGLMCVNPISGFINSENVYNERRIAIKGAINSFVSDTSLSVPVALTEDGAFTFKFDSTVEDKNKKLYIECLDNIYSFNKCEKIGNKFYTAIKPYYKYIAIYSKVKEDTVYNLSLQGGFIKTNTDFNTDATYNSLIPSSLSALNLCNVKEFAIKTGVKVKSISGFSGKKATLEASVKFDGIKVENNRLFLRALNNDIYEYTSSTTLNQVTDGPSPESFNNKNTTYVDIDECLKIFNRESNIYHTSTVKELDLNINDTKVYIGRNREHGYSIDGGLSWTSVSSNIKINGTASNWIALTIVKFNEKFYSIIFNTNYTTSDGFHNCLWEITPEIQTKSGTAYFVNVDKVLRSSINKTSVTNNYITKNRSYVFINYGTSDTEFRYLLCASNATEFNKDYNSPLDDITESSLCGVCKKLAYGNNVIAFLANNHIYYTTSNDNRFNFKVVYEPNSTTPMSVKDIIILNNDVLYAIRSDNTLLKITLNNDKYDNFTTIKENVVNGSLTIADTRSVAFVCYKKDDDVEVDMIKDDSLLPQGVGGDLNKLIVSNGNLNNLRTVYRDVYNKFESIYVYGFDNANESTPSNNNLYYKRKYLIKDNFKKLNLSIPSSTLKNIVSIVDFSNSNSISQTTTKDHTVVFATNDALYRGVLHLEKLIYNKEYSETVELTKINIPPTLNTLLAEGRSVIKGFSIRNYLNGNYNALLWTMQDDEDVVYKFPGLTLDKLNGNITEFNEVFNYEGRNLIRLAALTFENLMGCSTLGLLILKLVDRLFIEHTFDDDNPDLKINTMKLSQDESEYILGTSDGLYSSNFSNFPPTRMDHSCNEVDYNSLDYTDDIMYVAENKTKFCKYDYIASTNSIVNHAISCMYERPANDNDRIIEQIYGNEGWPIYSNGKDSIFRYVQTIRILDSWDEAVEFNVIACGANYIPETEDLDYIYSFQYHCYDSTLAYKDFYFNFLSSNSFIPVDNCNYAIQTQTLVKHFSKFEEDGTIMNDETNLSVFDFSRKVEIDVCTDELYDFLETPHDMDPMYNSMNGDSYFGVDSILFKFEKLRYKHVYEECRGEFKPLRNKFKNNVIFDLYKMDDRNFILGYDSGVVYYKNNTIAISYSDFKKEELIKKKTTFLTDVEVNDIRGGGTKYLIASSNLIYSTKDKYTVYQEVELPSKVSYINYIMPETDVFYAIGTDRGLYLAALENALEDDLHYHTVVSVKNDTTKVLSNFIDSHIVTGHADDSFMEAVNDKMPADLATFPANFTANSEVDFYNAVHRIDNDIVKYIEFNDENKYIKASVKNWATPKLRGAQIYSTETGYVDMFTEINSGTVFDLSKITYYAKFWNSGMKEIDIYVPSTATYYINNPRGFSNSDYSRGSAPRKNIDATFSSSNVISEKCTSLRIFINNHHFGFKNLCSIQINGSSLPLKIYKESKYCQVGRENKFDSVIQPSICNSLPMIITEGVNNISKLLTGDNQLILDFSVYGTDAQSIRIIGN